MSQDNNALPTVFVSRDFDHTVIGNFMKKKYAALSALIGKPETVSFFYSIADLQTIFTQFEAIPGIQGISFYLANYVQTAGNASVNTIVADGYVNELTLLISPYCGKGQQPTFFLISPLPGGGVINVAYDDAQTLISAYATTKVPLLTALMQDAGRTDFQETNLLYHEIKKWDGPLGFLPEAERQGAVGITAFLGAYAKDYTIMVPGGTTPSPVGWQTTLIFELTKAAVYNGATYYYDFDLEDTSSYQTRLALSNGKLAGMFGLTQSTEPPVVHKKIPKGGDTIAPCPPSCCPPNC